MVISPLYVNVVTIIKCWFQSPMVIDFKSKYLYTTAHIGKMLTMSFPQEKVAVSAVISRSYGYDILNNNYPCLIVQLVSCN